MENKVEYIMVKELTKKENNSNYFHKSCHELLGYYMINYVYVKDICDIIIRKIT